MQEIGVDCFCGGGGVSIGIRLALGTGPLIAINHDPEAIIMYQANHPEADVYHEDIWKVIPSKAVRGSPVAYAWFSPDCTHHSVAKGGRPVENKRRGLAWVIMRWINQVRPRVIFLENVKEFEHWGPLMKVRKKNSLFNEWEWKPDQAKKGMTFKLFVNRIRGCGYKVEWRKLVAADYGDPTTRERLFLIARCDGDPIVWPKKTHGPGLLPCRTAAECLDFSLPCPSIFESKKEIWKKYGLKVKRPLKENTLRRIARGIQKYVIDNPRPFIVGIDNKSSQSATWDSEEPLRTITTENRFDVVTPFLSKYHGGDDGDKRGQSLQEPLRTQDTSNRFGLVTAFLSKYFRGATGSEVSNPLPTVTAIDHNALVSAHLLKFYGTNTGSDMREPVPTITGQGQHLAEVRAFLIKYYRTGGARPVDKPLDTITSRDRMGLVTICGVDYKIDDIGLRMLTPRELARAHSFPENYILTGSNEVQVAKIGNSVPVRMVAAIVKANITLKDIKDYGTAS